MSTAKQIWQVTFFYYSLYVGQLRRTFVACFDCEIVERRRIISTMQMSCIVLLSSSFLTYSHSWLLLTQSTRV